MPVDHHAAASLARRAHRSMVNADERTKLHATERNNALRVLAGAGMTPADIAGATGINERTVRNILYRLSYPKKTTTRENHR